MNKWTVVRMPAVPWALVREQYITVYRVWLNTNVHTSDRNRIFTGTVIDGVGFRNPEDAMLFKLRFGL